MIITWINLQRITLSGKKSPQITYSDSIYIMLLKWQYYRHEQRLMVARG